MRNASAFFCGDIKIVLHLVLNWCILAPVSKITIKMNRQSITFTKPNDEWLKEMVTSEEYSSKSELVNDLIRQARKQQVQIDWLNKKLERAEKGGFTKLSKKEILKESKSRLNG